MRAVHRLNTLGLVDENYDQTDTLQNSEENDYAALPNDKTANNRSTSTQDYQKKAAKQPSVAKNSRVRFEEEHDDGEESD